MTAADAFESEFGLTLCTPSELPPEVEGRVENWRPGGITTLARSLALIPANRDTVLRAVRGTRVCVVRDLEFVGVPHDATATEFFSDPVTELVSLDLHIFDPARWEHDLGVPLLAACLVEELGHIFDGRLERSAFWELSSAGTAWLDVEFSASGVLRPFAIPNRRASSDMAYVIEEDWASALMWYVFRSSALRAISPARYRFMRQVFSVPLPLRPK